MSIGLPILCDDGLAWGLGSFRFILSNTRRQAMTCAKLIRILPPPVAWRLMCLKFSGWSSRESWDPVPEDGSLVGPCRRCTMPCVFAG